MKATRRTALTGLVALGSMVATDSRGETRLSVTPSVLSALAAFRREPKFGPTEDYTGFQPDSDRPQAEAALNTLIDHLIAGLPSNPTKTFVVDQIEALLPQFEDDDTEDREQLCRYLVHIKDIVGIDSLGGLLNRWMYGFDPTSGRGN
jgi:hypothetical protein